MSITYLTGMAQKGSATMPFYLICFFVFWSELHWSYVQPQSFGPGPSTTVTSALEFSAIPENFTMTIACPAPPYKCNLEIFDATYRQLCDPNFEMCASACTQSIDVSSKVKRSCIPPSGNSNCTLEVRNDLYGNHCVGRLKHLLVSFKCTCTDLDDNFVPLPQPPSLSPGPSNTIEGGGQATSFTAMLVPNAGIPTIGPRSPVPICYHPMFKRMCSR